MKEREFDLQSMIKYYDEHLWIEDEEQRVWGNHIFEIELPLVETLIGGGNRKLLKKLEYYTWKYISESYRESEVKGFLVTYVEEEYLGHFELDKRYHLQQIKSGVLITDKDILGLFINPYKNTQREEVGFYTVPLMSREATTNHFIEIGLRDTIIDFLLGGVTSDEDLYYLTQTFKKTLDFIEKYGTIDNREVVIPYDKKSRRY